MRKFVKTGCVLLSMLLVTGTCSLNTSDNITAATSGINVNYRTQEEIRQYAAENPFDYSLSVYDEVPNYTTAPYSAGKLSDETLHNALNAFNTVRFIAGLDEVALSDEYNELCQAGTLVNAVNNQLAHRPEQPADMSDELYQMGLEGASSSNIGWGYGSLAEDIIGGWMKDASASNIDALGHRRWCLNPSMNYIGFGNVSNFYAMYAFDNIWEETEYYGVSWPAQVMPLQYFGSDYPWSISMGYEVDISAVEVTLTRQSDGKVWEFSESAADGYFNVNNDGYGRAGCIIFRPDEIEYSAGDTFSVEISGIEEQVSYTVEFFDLEAEENEYTAEDVSDYADFIVRRNDGSEAVADITGDERVDVFDVIFMKRMIIEV